MRFNERLGSRQLKLLRWLAQDGASIDGWTRLPQIDRAGQFRIRYKKPRVDRGLLASLMSRDLMRVGTGTNWIINEAGRRALEQLDKTRPATSAKNRTRTRTRSNS